MINDEVLYESHQGVATITINRPKQLNAINENVEKGLEQAWLRFNANDDDRVAVLTGAGNRAFTSGRDRSMTAPPDYRRFTPGVVIEINKPVIAAVGGWCIGGGLAFVQMADLCIASADAKFIFPEAKLGFVGGMISSLAARIPHKVAMELMLLGEEISVERAYQVGLVNKIVPVGHHLKEAQAIASRMATHAPLVMGMLKRFVAEVLPQSPVEKTAPAIREADRLYSSDDFQESLASIRESRAPNFKGR
jgi:enoyl-CoA hydratase/carnithine racemase